MGLILWIDDNQFAASLLEKIFKKKNLPFYHLPLVDDCAYLIDDLKPSLIVLDNATALKSLDAFKEQYQKSVMVKKIPMVVLNSWDQLEFIDNKCGQLERKFDPFTIPEKLESFLKN